MSLKPSRWTCGVTPLMTLNLLMTLNCAPRRETSAPALQPGGAPWPAPASAEAYRSNGAVQVTSAPLYLPGTATRSLVTYQMVDGLAVMEGDIMLGPTHALSQRYGSPPPRQTDVKSAVVMIDRSYLWPNAEIPYEIHPSAQSQQANIQWAIDHLATTPLRVRPRTSRDADYVVFSNQGSGCWSELGRVRGVQTIQVEADCSRGSIVHELLHAAGFMHEQTRSDRDQYVTVMWDEIAKGKEHNFAQHPDMLQDIGAYDYDSILHYSTHGFSRRGNPTLVPKVAGARIGNREGLSALDRAAIEQVYGTAVTPTPAPPAPVPARPAPAPAPAARPPAPAPRPPAPAPAPQPAVSSVIPGSYAGQYSSELGPVACSQNSTTVQCSFSEGSLLCSANGTQLDCGWSGRGFGRAAFLQQPNGTLSGAWGDAFSNTSRGKWTLQPLRAGGQAAATPAPSQPNPLPPKPTAPTPAPAVTPPRGTTAGVSLTGSYTTSRGPMTCTEASGSLTCEFREASGTPGRLDCNKDASGLQLLCTWSTFLPQPGGGRAVFTRPNVNSRTLTGTWGHFLDNAGGGAWSIQGQ